MSKKFVEQNQMTGKRSRSLYERFVDAFRMSQTFQIDTTLDINEMTRRLSRLVNKDRPKFGYSVEIRIRDESTATIQINEYRGRPLNRDLYATINMSIDRGNTTLEVIIYPDFTPQITTIITGIVFATILFTSKLMLCNAIAILLLFLLIASTLTEINTFSERTVILINALEKITGPTNGNR